MVTHLHGTVRVRADWGEPSPCCEIISVSLPEVLTYILHKVLVFMRVVTDVFCVFEGKHSVKFCYIKLWFIFYSWSAWRIDRHC
jgi:hypothetical protein